MKTRQAWSNEDIKKLIELYPDTKSEKIAIELNRPLKSVYGKAKLLSLKKSEAFKSSPESGRTMKGDNRGAKTRFKPGDVPFTKGKKQLEFMSEEAIERTKASRFQKGSLPHNTKFNGAVSIRKDKKSGRKYKWIRVNQNEWHMLHIVVWRESNGDVPSDHLICFKDNNPMNCDLTNLECIPKEDHMKKNTIHRFPEDLKEVIYLTTRLKIKLKKLNDGKEQNH